MYILLIVYFLLFIFLSSKNLKYGIYWIIFTLPAYLIRFDFFNLPTTLLEGGILILFLIWLIKNFKKLRINKGFLIPISLFLLSATVSVFVSPDFYSALGVWKAYFIEPILFLIVFVSTLKKEDLKDLFMVFGIQVVILSLFAIYQKFTGVLISNPFWADEATRRVTSFFSYPNALALYLAPLVVLFLGFSVRKYIYLAPFILGILAIYFTKSKGALIAILIGLIFYCILYKGNRKYFVSIFAIVIILSGLLVGFGKIDLKGTSTVTGGDSVSTRLEMWSETGEMLKTKPILGTGLAGYQTAVAPFHEKEYIEVYLYPHNIFLNFWSEIGILGLISFILIIICFYIYGFKKYDKWSILVMAPMTTLLIHGLVDVPYFKNDLSILFWVIVGVVIILSTNLKIYEKNNL
jgi:putative inorganic carbon (hco3(-)) transporter